MECRQLHPKIATADGGLIAQTLNGSTTSTFDANGNITGQIPSLPTYSWKGAYQIGSVESVASELKNMAKSFWAKVGGNLSGNATAMQHPSIGLLWCGAGSRLSGTCVPQYQDLGFSYSSVTGTQVPDFSSEHPDWADVVQTSALGALKAAFSKFPILVQRGSTHTNQNNQQVLEQDRRVFVTGGLKPETGLRSFDGASDSYVFYQNIMIEAQAALGLNSAQTALPYPPQTQGQISQFQNFMAAIDKGIGNVAAHELSHQFVLPFADCDKPNSSRPPCPGDSNLHNYLYEYYGSRNPQYLYIALRCNGRTKIRAAFSTNSYMPDSDLTERTAPKSESRITWLTHLHEVLFSLNTGFALAFGFLAYVNAPLSKGGAVRDLGIKITNSRLRLADGNASGLAITFVACVVGVAIVSRFLLWLLQIAMPSISHIILHPIAGVMALIAVPACWFCASRLGRYISYWNETPSWFFLTFESSVTFSFLYRLLEKSSIVPAGFLFLGAHYALWAYFMWPAITHELQYPPELGLLALVAPCSGAAWMLYAWARRVGPPLTL